RRRRELLGERVGVGEDVRVVVGIDDGDRLPLAEVADLVEAVYVPHLRRRQGAGRRAAERLADGVVAGGGVLPVVIHRGNRRGVLDGQVGRAVGGGRLGGDVGRDQGNLTARLPAQQVEAAEQQQRGQRLAWGDTVLEPFQLRQERTAFTAELARRDSHNIPLS